MIRLNIAVLVLSATLLGGCAETELVSHWWKRGGGTTTSVSQGGFKVGNSYQIAGKWYTPQESYSYDETGIASWYGDEFHGKRTANGETFNMGDLTAAHKTLQLPSLVRVTNLDNGRSAVLRVNDRGPFARSRIIDVSHRAATVLGMIGPGTARVRVQVLERESRVIADAAKKGYTPQQQMAMAFSRPDQMQPVNDSVQVASLNSPGVLPAQLGQAPPQVTRQDIDDLNKQLYRKYPVSPTNLYIQVGSFTNYNNALASKQKLAALGRAEIYQTVVNGQAFNRVRLGPIADVPHADAMLQRTFNAGFSQARIVVD